MTKNKRFKLTRMKTNFDKGKTTRPIFVDSIREVTDLCKCIDVDYFEYAKNNKGHLALNGYQIEDRESELKEEAAAEQLARREESIKAEAIKQYKADIAKEEYDKDLALAKAEVVKEANDAKPKRTTRKQKAKADE